MSEEICPSCQALRLLQDERTLVSTPMIHPGEIMTVLCKGSVLVVIENRGSGPRRYIVREV